MIKKMQEKFFMALSINAVLLQKLKESNPFERYLLSVTLSLAPFLRFSGLALCPLLSVYCRQSSVFHQMG